MIPAAIRCAIFGAILLPVTGYTQEQEGSVTLIDRDGFRIKAGADVGLQLVTQHQAFWNLDQTFEPDSGYDSSPTWGEFHVKPFVTYNAELANFETYGKLSLVASANLGTDVFAIDSPNALTLEDAFIGLRNDIFDVSVGSQPYRLGTGMLLADGGGDGFERGAIIFGPRLAWEMTALGRLSLGKSSFEAFYLDPRELESGDTATKIAGASLTHRTSEGQSIGIAAGTILDSEALWVQAAPGGVGAPTFIPDGRDGLGFGTVWGNWAVDDRLSLSGDFAYQLNGTQDMAAWAGRVQVNYSFPSARFQPRIGYSYQTFSGDDPDTAELERFDPLFYDGSPAAWGSGSNASLVFLNTNISAHQVWAATTLSPRDFLTFRYFHVRANELFSPLQYGQGTRLDPSGTPTLIAGVEDRHLSDDLYLEYTRILGDNTFLTAGVGLSFPGEGMRDLGARDTWTGGYVNLVAKY